MNNLVIITSYIESISDDFFENITAEYTICLDGGYNIALDNNISPDLLIGDMDSLTGPIPKNIEAERFPPEKDFSDLELGLKKAVALNAQNVTILGGIGGRLDHTVANIQLISQYADDFKTLVMKDDKNCCFVINGNKNKITTLKAEKNSYFSVFSLSDKCTGLHIINAKYPLVNHTLQRFGSLCVSNEFVNEKDAVISLNEGTLLVVISRK